MQKRFDTVLTELLTAGGLSAATAGRVPSAVVSGADSVGSAGESGPKLLVAVSGGVDSMCLLHLLLHSSLRPQIVVAHCNFHLRGSESDGDEAFVRDFCASGGIKLCTADFDTAGHARENGLSIETAARELRYGWFGKLCRERGYGAVVVAHNANDSAETLFLNLLRGTGLRGLCGMRPLSAVPVSLEPAGLALESSFVPEPALESSFAPEPATGPATAIESRHIPLLRPLLTFTREEIEGYARANNIRWREDSTNAATDCRRNILRNEVFPLLAEINPSFVRTLNRDMRFFTDANDLVEAAVPDILGNGKIDIDELLGHDNWRLFLFHLLRPFNFNSTVIDDIAEHLHSDDGNHIFLSPTHRLQVTSRNLLLTERSETEKIDTYIYKAGKYGIEGGRIWELTAGAGAEFDGVTGAERTAGASEGRTIDIELIPREDLADLKAPRGTTYLDADKVGFPFVLRSWRQGDWFRPLGMKGATKKVSDLFVDLKYNMHDKERALFLAIPPCSSPQADLAEESHVLALLGERIDEFAKVDSTTTKILKIILS